MTYTDFAYCAGFFDGEGCISVTDRNKGYVTVQTFVANTNIEPLLRMKEVFGGNIYDSNDCFRWNLTGKAVGPFLQTILPYLIIKRDVAELAIALTEDATEENKVLRDYIADTIQALNQARSRRKG